MGRDHMSEGSSVSIGVVGLGYWGPNLLRGLVELPDVDVRYICDVSETRLGSLARRYAGARPTRCYEDLLEDPQLDAIVIATPVPTHFDLAAAALRAGSCTAPQCDALRGRREWSRLPMS